MNSFDSAFEKVCRLVDDFKENESHYLSPKYNEQQARKDYIDRLFIALGWDVNHTEQRNPYRQEVKVEETQINQRRPDYTFYIEPKFKEPKFFVEAKKPSRNLKDPMFYYQTIRYARFSSTPVAVLTDFEEFHILDCRFKPDINTVLKNPNHLCFNYNDYAVKEKFEKIYFLFARDEVAKNSLGEYSDSLPKLKIKGVQPAALKLQQQTIDEEFLEYLDGVREKLAKAFKKNDLNLTSDELTEATQRTIDRLVFIRFLEDKLIEDDDYVSKLGLSKNSWTDFISLCKTLNAKYNGIVFKEHFIDSQKFSGPELSGFTDICLDFSQRNPNGYNYNLIPIHILGSIYERFLGKVVVATDKRVRIDEKPEVRKAGGVYYTPKYIVDYIVQNTVGKLIENKTPKEISKLRFADIACGSGSFLIGVFETLLEYHNNYYWNHHDEAKADGCLFKDGAPVLSIRQKQNILLNNIFGVDIDHQAVEVTQLSLALKMLEDETLATANEMQVLFHEKILPDLTKNIVCGNSLIGTDILEGKMFPSSEERKLNPMDFEKRFPEIMKSGGFDAIVGNPPYSSKQSINNKIYKPLFNTVEYKCDLYSFFIERAFSLIKINGLLGYITPLSWMTNIHYEKLRKYLIDSLSLKKVILIDGLVFKNANIDTSLIFINRMGVKEECFHFIKTDLKNMENNFQIRSYSSIKNESDYSIIPYYDDKWEKIKKKIDANSIKLQEISKISLGMKLKSNDEFISNTKNIDNPDPIIFGKDFSKFSFIIPKRFFNFCRAIIIGGTKNPIIQKANTKIFIQAIRNLSLNERIIATIDYTGCFFIGTVNSITNLKNGYEYEYILGLINSNLLNTYFKRRFTTISLTSSFIGVLPIRIVNDDNDTTSKEKIVRYVKKILEIKKELTYARIEKDKYYYDNKFKDLTYSIDAEVYKLYGLTEEEIKIVEGKD